MHPLDQGALVSIGCFTYPICQSFCAFASEALATLIPFLIGMDQGSDEMNPVPHGCIKVLITYYYLLNILL